MKKLLLILSFIACLSACFMVSCKDDQEQIVENEDNTDNDDDDASSDNDEGKVYSIEKKSGWNYTVGDTLHTFRFEWNVSYAGDGVNQVLEHGGYCSYQKSLLSETQPGWMTLSYNYDRDGDSIKIYSINQSEKIIWLEGYIADKKMYLTDKIQNYELTQEYELINKTER